jgi:RNA polymerase sigma-70 factor (sigma-E family)
MRKEDRETAFRSFYFAEVPRLKRIAVLMTGEPERASELVHDALLRAYRRWPRIDDPGPYVRRALVNLCRNEYRRRIVERARPGDRTVVVAAADAQVAETLRVADALKVLSPIRRATIVLRFYEDMQEAEIARVLDRPLNTVKSDIRRALDRLRPVLQEGAATR